VILLQRPKGVVTTSPPPKLIPRKPLRALKSSQPYAFFVERERSESGEIVPVVTVFLTNRECPWRCIYCDLWKNTLPETVPLGAIPEQIDLALARLGPAPARQIKLYNAGSFFDPKAIPPGDFPAIAERVRRFERVIVECHPALVGEPAMRFRELLRADTKFEVAMGLEIADDPILRKLNKRMSLGMFAKAARFLRAHDIAMRAFVIVKPPFVRLESDALEFAHRSIDFAFDCGASVVSLIPARFGTEELDGLSRSGEFSPPQLETVEAALDYGVDLRRGRVLVDLWDLENLGGCCRCLENRVSRLREINLGQAVLPRISCAHKEALCVPSE